ncbi:MAG TPA: hypothetical protein V6C69_14160 [Trichormus sp.]|jgi:hypothetical protein
MNKTRSFFADRNSPGRAALAAIALAILLCDSLVCLTVAPPAKADSEAASESGAVLGGRRRGYRRMMRQQQQQQPQPNRQGMGHERQVQQDQQMEDRHLRSLSGSNTTRNYNFGGRRHMRNRNQSAQQGANPSAQTAAPQTSNTTP